MPDILLVNSVLCREQKNSRYFWKQTDRRMLALDVIEPAKTERASLIVFVPKEDSTPRVFVIYLKLNTGKICESYSILHTDEWNDFLGDRKIFLIMDVSTGCWYGKTVEYDHGKPELHFATVVFSLHSYHSDWESSKDASTGDGRLTYEGQEIDCPWLLWQYTNSLANAKQTHWPSFIALTILHDVSVTLDLNICELYTYYIDYISHGIRPGWL